MGIFKNSDKVAVRPLGLRTPLLKTFHKEVVRQNKPEVRDYLEPQQLGMSEAGAQKFVFSVHSGLNTNPQFIAVVIDLCNAF